MTPHELRWQASNTDKKNKPNILCEKTWHFAWNFQISKKKLR